MRSSNRAVVILLLLLGLGVLITSVVLIAMRLGLWSP
jgi:hypothetical protein